MYSITLSTLTNLRREWAMEHEECKKWGGGVKKSININYDKYINSNEYINNYWGLS
jgi:hypothetical protein